MRVAAPLRCNHREVELADAWTAPSIAARVAVLTGWLKQATGSYTAPMQAIWVILIIGVGAYLFLARERVVQPVPAVAV